MPTDPCDVHGDSVRTQLVKKFDNSQWPRAALAVDTNGGCAGNHARADAARGGRSLRRDRFDLQTKNGGEGTTRPSRLDPDKPVKRAIPVVPDARRPGRSAPRASRCDQSTIRQTNHSCKTNRRRRSISVTTTEARSAIFASPCSIRAVAIRRRIFRQASPAPNDHEHAPVNFHGYAACTRGGFQRDVKRAIAKGRPVLLLLRGDFKATQRALLELKQHRLAGRRFIEGNRPASDRPATERPEARGAFSRHRRGGGWLSGRDTGGACLLWQRGRFIPTPYPLPDSRWDFSRPLGERSGIFVGTREWNVPSRHHLAALILALGLGEPVTVFDEDPRRCRKVLAALGLSSGSLRIIERRLPYRDYLAEMARHKIVLQADKSAVPGRWRAMRCSAACPASAVTARSIGSVFPRLADMVVR